MLLSGQLRRDKKNHVLIVLSLPTPLDEKQSGEGFKKMALALLEQKEAIGEMTLLLADTLQLGNIKLLEKIQHNNELSLEEAKVRAVENAKVWENDPLNQEAVRLLKEAVGDANFHLKHWDDFKPEGSDMTMVSDVLKGADCARDVSSLSDRFKNKLKKSHKIQGGDHDKEILCVQREYIFEECARYACFHRLPYDYEFYVSERNSLMRAIKKKLESDDFSYAVKMKELYLASASKRKKERSSSDASSSDSERNRSGGEEGGKAPVKDGDVAAVCSEDLGDVSEPGSISDPSAQGQKGKSIKPEFSFWPKANGTMVLEVPHGTGVRMFNLPGEKAIRFEIFETASNLPPSLHA